MSEIKVNSIKGVGASTAAITVDNTAGTCTANLTNRTNKNLIINGAMQVAQRGTTYTGANHFTTVDRFAINHGGLNEDCTTSQADVAAGTTPYTLGFRKSFKITNGNHTAGAGAGDYIRMAYKVEAQDMASSGWNYTSSSSDITLSFWVKSSVSQNFNYLLHTSDGTSRLFPSETGTLSANTWTKITKTISGDSNLTFNNDNGIGLILHIYQFLGTNYTSSSVTNNQWQNYSGSEQTPDQTSTWYTTNDATFEITGVQLEVGSVATDFEHRSFGQELALCQRYYCMFAPYIGYNGRSNFAGISEGATFYTQNNIFAQIELPTTMRTTPSLVYATGTNYYIIYRQGGNQTFDDGISMEAISDEGKVCINKNGTPSNAVAGDAALWRLNNNSAYMAANAEL